MKTTSVARTGSMIGGISATHQRWHLLRGRYAESCLLCRAVGREAMEKGLQDRSQEHQGQESRNSSRKDRIAVDSRSRSV